MAEKEKMMMMLSLDQKQRCKGFENHLPNWKRVEFAAVHVVIRHYKSNHYRTTTTTTLQLHTQKGNIQ